MSFVPRSGCLPSCSVRSACPSVARADLDEYVKKPDSAFAWSQTSSVSDQGRVITSIKLTSQVWQGITWSHDLRVYEPREIVHPDAMLLFITGGDTERKASDDDHKQAFGLAQVCGARVAVLPQVPNQPLLDGKTEDELIAETFVRYLQTKDENWPLLFPMVKSAVKAMDAVQAWAKENGKPVTRFVVTGGSKRGWTTWLTGAVDDRVIAIAPMVIVMLNLGPQGPNQLKVWGQYSEQIHDYVERGLMETVATPTGTNLWKMVDPFTYRAAAAEAQAADQRRQRPLLDARCARPLLERPARAEVPDRAAQRRPRSESQPRLGDLGPGGFLPSRRAQSPDAAAHLGLCRGSRRRFPRHDPFQPGPAGGPDLDGPIREPRLPRIEVGWSAAQTRRDDDLPRPGPRAPAASPSSAKSSTRSTGFRFI